MGKLSVGLGDTGNLAPCSSHDDNAQGTGAGRIGHLKNAKSREDLGILLLLFLWPLTKDHGRYL